MSVIVNCYFINWASLVAQWLRICLPMQETQGMRVLPLSREDPPWRRKQQPTPVFLSESRSVVSDSLWSPWTMGWDLGSIQGWEDPLGRERLPYPLQYSGLNCIQSMGVTKSQTWLRDFQFHFIFTSSILACEIPWTEEPDGLQSVGLPESRTWLKD